MDIDRRRDQGGIDVAIERVSFCLNQLEKRGFSKNVDWSTGIGPRLTVEELIGALVSAEQVLFPDEDLE